MENNKYHVLFIEDQPLIVESYKNALSHVFLKEGRVAFQTDVAVNYDCAFDMVKKPQAGPIDIIILELNLFSQTGNKINSAEELGLKIRKVSPQSKLIISASSLQNYEIDKIFKKLNPEGFLIKKDITSAQTSLAISSILDGIPYYSKSVILYMRQQLTSDFTIDKINRQLLYELSLGTKMKDLPKILPLSIAGIEKRKRNLKIALNLKNGSDRDLLLTARDRGFL